MPRRAPSTKHRANEAESVESEKVTERFPFDGAVVVRPIPSFLPFRLVPSARYVIPPLSDPADWSARIAEEKERARALQKAAKTGSVTADPVDDGASATVSHGSLVLGRGTVTNYTAASGRIPELWSISYPILHNVDDDNEKDSSSSWQERITRSELLVAKTVAEKIDHSSLIVPSFPLATIQKFMNAHHLSQHTIAERVDIGMETAIQHSILWKLILVAACEFEREHQIQKAFEESKKKLEAQMQEERNRDKYNQGECPRYYTKHPTTYMGGHFGKEDTGNEAGDTKQAVSSLVPQHLGQRVRLGVSKAYEYFARLYPGHEYDTKDISVLVSSMLHGFDGPRRSSRFSNGTTQDEKNILDPIQSLLPKEQEQGGAVALALLHLLDMIPSSVPTPLDFSSLETYQQYRIREQASLEPVSVLDIPSVYAQGDEDDTINPFFMPSPSSIMLHLGRKQKSMSPADIQTAICYAIEDSIPYIIPLTPPSIPTQDIVSPYTRICLDCVSGDRLKDLPDFEPSSFAKCRFVVKTFQNDQHISDKDASRIQQEREKYKQKELERKQKEMDDMKQAERQWRLKKQYETWRFKSVQFGCTIWPSWTSHVEEYLRDIHKQTNPTLGDNESFLSYEGIPNPTSIPCPILSEENRATTQEVKDAEMASILSLEWNGGDTSMTGDSQRRSRRANRDSTSEALSFYGSSVSLNPQQLLETVHRLVVSVFPKHITLMDLRKLLIDSHGEMKGSELKRIRSALGKLLFRQGKIARLMVTCESDRICWTTLLGEGSGSGEALVHLGPSQSSQLKDTSIEGTDVVTRELESDVTEDRDTTQDDIHQENPEKDSHTLIRDLDREQKEIKILETYMASLHRVELALRFLLLRKYRNGNGLQFVTPEIIALAADEKDGEMESSDTREIEILDKEGKVGWIRDPPHPLLGQIIYRSEVDEVDSAESEHWYKVLDYTPSIPLVKSQTDPSKSEMADGLREGSFVERRIHFRAVSIKSAKNATPRIVILTESQVNVGLTAALMQTEFTKLSPPPASKKHPFDGLDGLKFVLSPIGGRMDTFYYVQLVGHDTFLTLDRNDVDYRIYVMVEEKNEMSRIVDTPDYLKPGNAFWASISTDATVISPLGMETTLKIMPQEYHSSTPAYMACEAVIEYLKSNVKIMPFLMPVDPVALQIPTYFDVIKHPMDLSTVERNLGRGDYGRIPPNDSFSSPISKMLNGPFYSHIMRIFDNALTFNPPGDWIHNDAAQLKRLAAKKIEALTLKAEREACATSGGTGMLKRNVYAEVDSDVDAYEYESDYEDEDSNGKKRKRKRGTLGVFKKTMASRNVNTGRSVLKMEDNSCRPIEGPVLVPVSTGTGIFANLPIVSDARLFGLPQEWSCRVFKSDSDETKKLSEEEERQRLLLLHMQLDQQSSTRRSSRSHDAMADNLLSGVMSSKTNETVHIKYYFSDESILPEDISIETVARTRVHLESIRETLHEEYYSRLFYKYFTNNRSSPISATTFHYGEGEVHGLGYGMFTDNSFPPFLGRIVPVGFCPSASSGDNFCDVKWEIRAPYIIPALRWVLRGLIQSGHLSEIEPLSNSLQDNIPVVSGDGVILINHAYYHSNVMRPYDALDVKEIARRKRSEHAPIQEPSRLDVNLSEYEKARLERVERNKERLKLLGLA